MLLDFDDFGGFRFEDDGLYDTCLVSNILRSGGLSDIDAPDMVAKYNSNYQNGVYTHKIETFIGDLSADLMSTLHLASKRRSLVFFRANNGRYFGFGYEAGAKLSYTNQTNDGIGSLVTITASSIYPLFEVLGSAFGEYVPTKYTITVGVNPINKDQCKVTASGDIISLVQAPNKETYTITIPKNGTATVYIVSEDGYKVRQLNVDSASQGAISEYTFQNIDTNHTMYIWMEVAVENPTEFLVRSDLPGMYYSSTQSVFDALKEAYPNGLTQNVTVTCVKTAKEKRDGGSWVAELSNWNKRAIGYLTFDGADKLTYDGMSLGALQFKEVDNILLRNVSFINCANYASENPPGELYAIYYIGNANMFARNFMVYQCKFDGAYPEDTTKMSRRTIGSKYSENLTILGCDMRNDYGNCMVLSDCLYMSLLKNVITVAHSEGIVAHPSIMTLKNCYSLIVEDNALSGDNRENYFELSNVDRLYFRRNNVSGGGGRAITMSALKSMKEVIIESNLFVGMINAPIGAWMKDYINFGTAQIQKLNINNNTCYMSGRFFEQYVTRGGTVEYAEIFNNIVINATGASNYSINAFVINRCKILKTGNNLYESMRGLIVSPNEENSKEYITIDWTTGRDIAKLQAVGYEGNSVEVEDGTKLLEIQDGKDTYKLISGLDYYSNMAYFPKADIEYKEKASTGNTRGCYNLAGTPINEKDEITGYTGEDYSDEKSFNSSTLYSTMADSILCLKHNTLERTKVVVFSVIGTQHAELLIGRSGIIHTYCELDENGEYKTDELYTINTL